mgnify:CR=1 FL=1
MDNLEYENFLLEIADKVEALVKVSENRKRFEQHSCDLGKKHAAYKEAKERGAKQMPYDPLSRFLSVLTHDKDIPDVVPRLKIDEALAYYYFSLATIHDKMRNEGYIPIHNDSRAKQLANTGVWPIIENLCLDKQFIINTAFGHVEADLPKKPEGNVVMMSARSSKENWEAIRSEYDISKKDFGKKINFVSNSFQRKIIFRDIEHAFVLASQGFPKPSIILAGGVIEELLRLYLENKNIQPKCDKFFAYIEACENNKLLKRGVSRLTDSIRDFRNLVHLDNEKTKRHTISKPTAKGAVASIFTIANDFQKVSSS